jgi:hypothetical protein
MGPPLLASTGFAVADLWVPPFEVRRGDCLEVRMPRYEAGADIAEALSGRRGVIDGIHGTAAVRWVQPAWDTRGRLAQWLRPCPTALEWLRPFTRSRDEALALLRDIDVDPPWRLNRMPGNPRALLGLVTVWTADVDVIILSMAGCDPTGRRRLTQMIVSRLDRWAAIELTSPYWHIGQKWPGQSSLPNARLVEIKTRNPALIA